MSLSPSNLLVALPAYARDSFRQRMAQLKKSPAQAGILSGSLIMLVGSILVSAINFGYNIATAHLLGPAAFGHASVAVTLLMLASAVTLAFQLLCAKFVARNPTAGQKLSVMRLLRDRAWALSITLALILALFSNVIAAYLRLPSGVIVLLLALGILFYIPLGVKRGGLQGMCDFRRLTGNFVLESAVKFVAALILMLLLLGAGPNAAMLGAVAAITLSVIAAYYFPRLSPELRKQQQSISHVAAVIPSQFLEGMQASVFFIGQVLINNIDIVLVKHFFSPREAGFYAAIALVGRVLYFAAWSVVSAMFPITAQAKPEEENRFFLRVPIFLVLTISSCFVLFTALFPHLIMHVGFGAGFHGPEEKLLAYYAIATGLYALSVVLMAYEISRKIANTAWIQLIFSGLVIVGIDFFHSSLFQVIEVQIVLMLALLVTVSIPFVMYRPRRARVVVAHEEAAA